MKKIIIFGILMLNLVFTGIVYADTTIHLDIKTLSNTLYDQDITVAPCDSDNAGTFKITPYCAILQSGMQNDWNWAWAPGAFLNSLGGIAGYTSKDANNNDVYHYWSWSLNGTEGSVGLNQYDLQPNDLISLDFIDPSSPISSSPVGSGPLVDPADLSDSLVSSSAISVPEVKTIFDTQKAFDFLIGQQKDDGSFGEDIYTDWAAIALASGNNLSQTLKLVRYFGESKVTGTLLPDYERKAIALLSLGLNPYSTNGENYIEKITAGFDGAQFGDVNEDNDDIFALIVLQNTGYGKNEKMISNDIDFILSRQKENGSWDESVDMTGASIEALSIFSQDEKVKNALVKAENFLRKTQKDDGGWGNPSATAWAMEGIRALHSRPEDWTKNNNTPLHYLAKMQDADGGIAGENMQSKIWQTAYVVSALSGETWNEIMQKFEKPKIPVVVEIPEEILQKKENKIMAKKSPTTDGIAKAKNKEQKPKNLTVKNMATPIAAITNVPEGEKKSEPVKNQNWLVKFLGAIFGF